MVLAVICQGLVAFEPMAAVWRTVAIWPALRNDPTPNVSSFFATLVVIVIPPVLALGLALSRSWGWSFAMIVNAIVAGALALGLVTEPQSAPWETWEMVAAIVAIAVLLLPPVRAHYSRQRTPWILSWWAQPLNTGIDKVLVHLVAVAHVLFNAVFLLKALASFPYSIWVLPWPAVGIFVGVKLFSRPKLGRLLHPGLVHCKLVLRNQRLDIFDRG
jgi:hypothetical protein